MTHTRKQSSKEEDLSQLTTGRGISPATSEDASASQQPRQRSNPARKNKQKAAGEQEENPLYTAGAASIHAGEPQVEEAPLGFYKVDTDQHRLDDHPLDPEMGEDSLYIGTDPEAVAEEIGDYTEDPDIIDDFEQRQKVSTGSDQLLERLAQHHSKTPELSGEDIDADWEQADQSGEEAVGGSVPTPDQDVVEELGDAVGISYEEDEELDTYGKLQARDEKRWELDPESAQDDEEEIDAPLEDDEEQL